MTLTFSKIENSEHAQDPTYASSIQMGIENAPARLIVKYITDMYENPLAAAIRETVSNALDAMERCNRGYDGLRIWYEPIEGDERQWLHVMDDGCGMTREVLMGIYTQYGVSDKRAETLTTGAFGLGAKAPLAFAAEMQVLTKTPEDGCLFVSAYRTDVDDFVTNLPVPITSGSEKVTIYRSKKGRIIPPDMENGGYSDELRQRGIARGEMLRVEDIIDGESGTLVRFPIGKKPALLCKNEKDKDDVSTYVQANGITDAILRMLRGCRQLPCDGAKAYKSNFFHVGDYEIADAHGKTLPYSLYLPNGIGIASSASPSQLFQKLSKCHDGITLLDEVAFKIGGWAYPADNKPWVDFDRKDPRDTVFEDRSILIDIPSCAFAFMPSRDRFVDTEECRKNILAIVNDAASHIEGFLSDPARMSELCNWIKENNYSEDVTIALRDIVGWGSAFTLDISDGLLHVENRAFDLSVLDIWRGRVLADLANTPLVSIGKVVRKPGFDRYENMGVFCMPTSLSAQLLGKEVNLRTASCSEDGSGESNFRCAGFADAKKKTAADGACISNPSGWRGEYSKSATKESPITMGDVEPVTLYPVGMAVRFLSPYHKCHVVVIDASRKGIAYVRRNLENIYANLGIPSLDNATRNVDSYYILIPPKSADPQDKWDADEIDHMYNQIDDVFEGVHEVTHVTWRDLYRLCHPVKRAEEKSDANDFEKMLKRHGIYELRRIYDRVKDKNGNWANGDVTEVKVLDASNRYPSAAQTLALMKSHPEKVAVIASDPSRCDPYLAGSKFAGACLAMGWMPDSIEYVICLSARNFNKSRAEALGRMGILCAYDETGKSYGKSLAPAHAFALSCDEKFRELEPASDEVQPFTNQTQIVSKFDDYDELRQAKVVYEGAPTAALAAYIAKMKDKKVINTYKIAMELLPHDGGFAAPTFSEEWVRKLTFGHESIDHEFNTTDIEPWRCKLFSQFTLEDQKLGTSTKDSLNRFVTCLKVWRHKMSGCVVKVDASALDDENLDMFCALGNSLGVKNVLDAWYNKKILLEDLLTGEGYSG